MTLLIRLFEAAHRPDGDEQSASVSRASCSPPQPGQVTRLPILHGRKSEDDRSQPNNLVSESNVKWIREDVALVAVQDE